MRRPVSHIMGSMEAFSSKAISHVPVFRLTTSRMIISCPFIVRFITGVISRRCSFSWKPFVVMSSLRPHFISSVSQSRAVTKDNGDVEHGSFGWPQVCQENESWRSPGGRGGMRASQKAAASWLGRTSGALCGIGFRPDRAGSGKGSGFQAAATQAPMEW